MNFDEMCKDGDRVHYDGDEYVKSDAYSGACWRCGDTTKWVSISFAAFLCSTECADAKWHEYEIASSKR